MQFSILAVANNSLFITYVFFVTLSITY